MLSVKLQSKYGWFNFFYSHKPRHAASDLETSLYQPLLQDRKKKKKKKQQKKTSESQRGGGGEPEKKKKWVSGGGVGPANIIYTKKEGWT